MEKYRILSDIFAVPGLLCLFLGALGWMAGQGAFRGLAYVLKNALRLLTFQPAKRYEPQKTKQSSIAALLWVGGICVTIAGIFAGLYQG